MGLGGALIWTGLACNLKQRYPNKQIIFVYKKSLRDFVLRRPHPDHVVYQNNEDIRCVSDHITWMLRKWFFRPDNIIIVDMDNPDYFYYEDDMEEKIFYETGKHAIQIACDVHDISNARLQPRIWLSKKEIAAANHLLKANGLLTNQYICVEPHAKKDFTPNKAWFWENWQRLINLINRYIRDNNLTCKLVQIGLPTDKVLDGVTGLTGKTSFRETAQILKKSITFIGYIGGLAHLSKAVGKKNIVLVSAWEPLELASYPDDINFYTNTECKNCGLKTPCPINRECMSAITVEQVYEAVQSMLRIFVNTK